MSDINVTLNIAPPQLAEWVVGSVGIGVLVTAILAMVVYMLADDFGPSEEFAIGAVIGTALLGALLTAVVPIALYGAAWSRYRALTGR